MKDIKYDVDEHKATITLNRPDALNALSPHMISELRAAYDEAEDDDNIWLLIVTGAGRAFCTGADVTEIPEDGRVIYERPYLSTYDQWEAPQEGTPPFRRMAKPVLTAINGLCCGAGWTGSPPATSPSPPTRRHSSTPTSALAWWPAARWCGWPGCCPATSRCAWR
jgi:enoyl-CoA hydratase/carnithine racemase